jgi:hypothetical protein
MNNFRLFTALAAASLLLAGPAWAQDRGAIMAGVMFQPTTSTFSDVTNFTYFVEQANQTGNYDVGDSIGLDIGGVARVWRSLGAGVAVTTASRPTSAQFDGSMPHPFFFGRTRSAATEIPDLERSELGVHISAAYMLPTSGSLSLTFFGGPSFFNTKQDVAESIDVNEVYPYDNVEIEEGTIGELSETIFGFHAGADVSWYFTQSFGVGGLIRFAQGTKELSIGDGEPFDLEVGGLQASVGVRFRF